MYACISYYLYIEKLEVLLLFFYKWTTTTAAAHGDIDDDMAMMHISICTNAYR